MMAVLMVALKQGHLADNLCLLRLGVSLTALHTCLLLHPCTRLHLLCSCSCCHLHGDWQRRWWVLPAG